MATPDPITAVAPLTRELARATAPELWEVLSPTIQWRSAAGKLIAVFPNQVWRDVFREHAAEIARRFLRTRELGLNLVCRQEAVATIDSGGQRFGTFLTEPGNQLALTACRRAVEAPGLEHNPLYLHGPAGCGKSHLLSAIGAEYRMLLGDSAAVQFSGPGFVAKEAQQLSERGDTPLRRRLEEAAVLIIDDLDALAHRQLAQEELFHLINRGLERGQQLVFAGRHSPRKLPGFEDRLVTRLGWGLAVGIEPPHSETRLALLRQLAGDSIADTDPAELARWIDTIAPDMHAVVMLASRIADGERPGSGSGSDIASFDRILQVVADHCGLRPGDIAGKRRHRAVAQARQLALLLGRRLTGHSLEALGGMVGGRDHSTVLYGIRQAQERHDRDPAFARQLTALTQVILRREDESTLD